MYYLVYLFFEADNLCGIILAILCVVGLVGLAVGIEF